MGACGIICEYNPFHTGHAYQIAHIKEALGLDVVCAMSGNFTQRAEPACMDKKTRADIALKNGADIVLEIPFPFCSMSANGFATAGVHILANSGLCSHIAFGSECGDIELLKAAANITLSKEFEKDIREHQKQFPTLSYAKARSAVMQAKHGKDLADILSSPNDILAVEYIRANILLGSPLIPIAVKRTTPRDCTQNGYASSSFIRNAIFSETSGNGGKLDQIPQNVSLFLPTQTQSSFFVTENSDFEKLLHLHLLTKQPEELRCIAEIPQGSQFALIKAAFSADNYAQLIDNMRSKSFTDAKIRRMILFSLTGVKSPMLKQTPLYTFLLSYNDKGRSLLSHCRNQKNIIIASTLSNIKQNKDAYSQYLLLELAEEVLQKCRLK